MNPLYQRLKELDRDTFEKLCFQLLKARFPGMNIRAVDGSGGDGGLDIFLGEASGIRYVWQCKSFPNGIRSSQKKQVKESLDLAILNHSPRRWVLCLSIDPTPKAWEWIDSLKDDYMGKADIGVMPASDIVHELCYRGSIRRAFFPHATVEDIPLREAITGTAGLSDDQVREVTAETADQYLRRLQEQDGRFSYRVSFTDGDLAPKQSANPGTMMTFSHDSAVVDVFGRDVEALRLDPPMIHMKLRQSGQAKLADFQKTGREAVLSNEDVLEIASDFGFMPTGPFKTQELRLAKRPTKVIPTRVSFGMGPKVITYDYLELELVRAGTEESEFRTRGPHPFVLFFEEQGGRGSVRFDLSFDGYRPNQVIKFLSALKVAGQRIEVVDLNDGQVLFRCEFNGAVPEWLDGEISVLEDAVEVEKHYGVLLRVPQFTKEEDARNLYFLRGLVRGLVGGEGSINLTFTKEAERPDISKPKFDEFKFTMASESIQVFGQAVATGDTLCQLSNLTSDAPEEFWPRFDATPVGTEVEATLKFESSLRPELPTGGAELAPVQARNQLTRPPAD